jgi:hypothetical protein
MVNTTGLPTKALVRLALLPMVRSVPVVMPARAAPGAVRQRIKIKAHLGIEILNFMIFIVRMRLPSIPRLFEMNLETWPCSNRLQFADLSQPGVCPKQSDLKIAFLDSS